MRIRHGRIELALHQVQAADGMALLLLHALHGSCADWGAAYRDWPGPVYALDFCGHGHSDSIVGGGYFPELLVADADAALAQIGTAAVVGAGLGAYIAVLLAGTRAAQVPAVLLQHGAGITGGGEIPDFAAPTLPFPQLPGARSAPASDPAVAVLDYFVRPTEYVLSFASAARRMLLCDDQTECPAWWQAVRGQENVERVRAAGALERLATVAV